nr:peptidoglycan-binding protein [Fructobacillus broussonetiae]
MMFNKILLTSAAVVGLALTAANQQFNNHKSTSDQAVKVSGSIDGKMVNTAVSSLDNIKNLENSAASQQVQQEDASAEQAEDTQTEEETATPAPAVSETPKQTTTASGDINWLIQQESSGNVNAQNGSFYGIGQLSPSAYATYAAGQDYVGNYDVQLQAMQGYIAGRYGSVQNAISHFQSNGWY